MNRLSGRLAAAGFAIFLAVALVKAGAQAAAPAAKAKQPMTSGAGYRFTTGGWTYVHLEGDPGQIGFQHGQLLAAEIRDIVHVAQVENLSGTRRNWSFYREASRKVFSRLASIDSFSRSTSASLGECASSRVRVAPLVQIAGLKCLAP